MIAGRERWSLALLVALCLISLRLTTTVNSLVAQALQELAPEWTWIAAAAIPSCLVALAIYLAIRPRRPLAPPAPDTYWPGLLRIGGAWLLIWLTGSVAVALARGEWTPYATEAADIAAFLVFGSLGEELLFRGAICELAQRAFLASRTAPVAISAVAFSLHHFEFHADPLSAAALGQVAFTLPMGIVFAQMRARSASIWPGWVLHVLTNLPGSVA